MSSDASADLEIRPVTSPIVGTVRPPGSKSLTNRALVCAALARGRSGLVGALRADDTDAMIGGLRALGVAITTDEDGGGGVVVLGCGGRPPAAGAVVDAGLSGTTSRFLAPVASLVRGHVVLDGGAPLRRRPMGGLLAALVDLGAVVEPLGEPGHLPVGLSAGPGASGGRVDLAGDVSSQFLSALLLSAPCFDEGLDVHLTTPLVSRPYVELTIDMLAAFGAEVTVTDDWSRLRVAPTGVRAVERYVVEPDASAASYFAAAAAVTDGSVRIEGLGRNSRQGDLRFLEVLSSMGADVTFSDAAVVVRGTGRLHGVTVDMTDISDTAQSLAAVATFADSPSTVRGIGFIRGKETDRIAAVVTELRRLGVDASEERDGFTVVPGSPRPGTVRTYDDHRMAMSFAVIGLRAPGIRIRDPGCVAKTYPGFWEDLERLRRGPDQGPGSSTP